MALEALLIEQNSLQYFTKFAQEEIDVEALSLLQPNDLRSACGVPLGRSAKLINAAQRTFSDSSSLSQPSSCVRKCVGDDLVVPSEKTVEFESNALQITSGMDIRSPNDVASRQQTAVQSAAEDTLIEGKEAEQVLAENDAQPLEPASPLHKRSGVFGSPAAETSSVGKLLKAIPRMIRLLHPMDFIIPADHSESFKLCILFSKSGQEVKEYTANVAQTWILVDSLGLGFLGQLWAMCPDEAGALEKTVYELICSCTLLLMFFNLGLWAVLFVVITTINAKNMKAFAFANLGVLELIELLLVAVCYSWAIIVAYIGYLRIDAVAPGLSWAKVLWLTVSIAGFTIFLICLNSLSLLSIYSGAMSRTAVSEELFSSASEMESALFESTWRACRSRSSRAGAVKYHFYASKAASTSECEVQSCRSDASASVGFLRSESSAV